ncbi:MAG: nitrilase-related carbon-nitrogen hydrolase [Armatimonadota bacterium]
MTAAPRSLRIAGLQALVTSIVADNERRLLAGIERAAADAADILLTPEGSLSGYRADFDREEVGEAVERVRAAAAEAGVGLALGTCYKQLEGSAEHCYNQVRLYAPDGTHLGSHAKILRCSPLDHPGTGEMRDYVEGTLRTFDWRGVSLGMLICNDLWATPGYTTMPNPYLPWRLKQMGARLLLHAINSGSDLRVRPFHESSTELWARILRLPIVQVNAAREEQPVNCRSGVIGVEGERLMVAPEVGEQYFVCDVKIAA